MGLGIRKKIKKFGIQFNLFYCGVISFLFGFEAITSLIKKLDKQSLEAVLRRFGAKVGQDCDIESGLTIHNAKKDFSNLQIEGCSHIGKDVLIDLQAGVVVRERSTISMRTIILTHVDMGKAGPFAKEYSQEAQIEIGPSAFIGAGAIILPGVKIGERSIVAAGALVNENVAADAVVMGVPAKEIRRIKAQDI